MSVQMQVAIFCFSHIFLLSISKRSGIIFLLMYLKSEHIVLWRSKLCMLSANRARFPSLLCLLCLSLDLLLLIRHSFKEFWYSGVFLVYKFFKSLCSMHAWKYSILQKDGHQKFTTEMVIISKLILTYLNYFFPLTSQAVISGSHYN